MKIFIACSKHFYDRIPEIQRELEEEGHEVFMPNSYDRPFREEEMKDRGLEAHVSWKAEMMRRDKENIEPNDAVLVLNFEKNGQPNYIGGATFLEMYKAWELGKKLFLYNPIPDSMISDEIVGMAPVILNQNLKMVSLLENLLEELKHIQEPVTRYALRFEKTEDKYRVFIEDLQKDKNHFIDLTTPDYQEAQKLYEVIRERLFYDWIKIPSSPKSL